MIPYLLCFQMRLRISIKGSVRPSIRPSVRPYVTRFFKRADYGRIWSEMTGKTVKMLQTRQKVFRIVPKCPKTSQMSNSDAWLCNGLVCSDSTLPSCCSDFALPSLKLVVRMHRRERGENWKMLSTSALLKLVWHFAKRDKGRRQRKKRRRWRWRWRKRRRKGWEPETTWKR